GPGRRAVRAAACARLRCAGPWRRGRRSRAYSHSLSNHRRHQRTPGEMGLQIVPHQFTHRLAGLDRAARLVRLQDDIVELQEAPVDIRLVPEHVETCAADLPLGESFDKGGFVDDGSAETLTKRPDGPSASNTSASTMFRVASPPATAATRMSLAR